MYTVLAFILLMFTSQANEIYGQHAAPGFTLDSSVTYITYVVETGKDNRGHSIYEKILAPRHGIKHTYNAQGKTEVDYYHRFDFGESDQ